MRQVKISQTLHDNIVEFLKWADTMSTAIQPWLMRMIEEQVVAMFDEMVDQDIELGILIKVTLTDGKLIAWEWSNTPVELIV